MSNFQNEVIEAIASKKGTTIASFEYQNAQGEVASYNVMLGADTGSMYQKDIEILTEYLTNKTLSDTDRLAATELLASRQNSLLKGIGSQRETKAVPVPGVPGVSMDLESEVVYVSGKVNSKTVISEATTPSKPVNSSPKTLAKKRIEKLLPSSKLRTFRLDRASVAKLRGEVIEA